MALLTLGRKDRGNLATFRSQMNDLFNAFLEDWDMPLTERKFWPAIDIADNEDAVIVKAEVPGCKAEDIDISVHGNILTISGEKKEEKEKKEKCCYHVERVYGSFRREIGLPADVKVDKIEAVYKDGILSLTLPKTEKSKAVKVKVKEQ